MASSGTLQAMLHEVHQGTPPSGSPPSGSLLLAWGRGGRVLIRLSVVKVMELRGC